MSFIGITAIQAIVILVAIWRRPHITVNVYVAGDDEDGGDEDELEPDILPEQRPVPDVDLRLN